jgi:hypothetical protein
MGEVHYSRIPADEWRSEVQKMKAGGVTIIATYVFWNHIEEEEGVFRWDGQRSLRNFLEICKQEEIPVVLRLGPFCHGEVRNGGIPEWMWKKTPSVSPYRGSEVREGKSQGPIKLRSTDPRFLYFAERLYRQIFTQVQGLQWKDGGPVIAAQFDNEYRGSGDYLMALKKIALSIGFDLPFYTRTGWPELSKPVPFGEMLPLYGDYADGFWDKEVKECVGSYYKAFNFRTPSNSADGGENMGALDGAPQGKQPSSKPSLVSPTPLTPPSGGAGGGLGAGGGHYPYFTCELGGGMATAYHRRPFIYPEDAYSMALVKLGSGSNLLGYYMYHGGTNPVGKLNTLNEVQTSPGTANNDLPVCTYDFQAPLGEFGQTYPQYFMLRPLHLFMQDYGELLAPMEATFPAKQDLKKGEDTGLRWAVRSREGQAFVFVNNYERLQNLSAKKNIALEACGVKFPKLTIPAGCMAVFPVNVDGIRYATAQLVAKRNGRIYLMQIPGIPATISMQNGKTLKNVKPKGEASPVYDNLYLLTQNDAQRLFFTGNTYEDIGLEATVVKLKEAGALRTIKKGRARVAEAPSEADWEQAAVYRISVPTEAITQYRRLLSIAYRGDCARLYAGGQLIADNFYYGRPFLYGLWRLPEGCSELELRVLPLQPEAPVYLPREADRTAGECVKKVGITAPAQQVISLEGTWDFRMDNSASVSVPDGYDDEVTLPGSMLTNGKGNPVSVKTQWTGSLYDSSFYFNPYMEKYRKETPSKTPSGSPYRGSERSGEPSQMKFPFFLTPERHYVGAAWYHRSVYVPKSWSKQSITLFLERPHIETTVFVNGKEVGHQMSLSTPHCYDVTSYLWLGEKNDISIRVYNGIENVCVGQDSHSVTDQTQGNWNGIVGRMELQAQPVIWRKRVVTHPQDGTVDVLINDTTIRLSIGEEVKMWDEFNPHLYTRVVNYRGIDIPVTFGFREITAQGRQLMLNGRPLFLRGTVGNCCFPETGYPPTEESEWLRIFRKCKEYGLNHMRFHSYCPPEAAFAAADKVGIYLQAEGPSWPNHGVKLRRGMKIDQYLLEESKRIIDAYGHHPSFVMMAAGNEPAGDWVSYCNDWVKEMKQYDPTKIYAGASVGGGWAWDSGSEYHVKGGARGLDEWNRRAPSSNDDYYSGIEFPRNYKDTIPNNTPIVTHEKGQWCAFPDFNEIAQYTGAYKARNFEIFRDLLRDNGMGEMGAKFLHASGMLQRLCYKYEIERNLRTKDYAGFQLLGLNDYSGQGTALVGVLNVFWREKGYCTSRDWTEFCDTLVPLARLPKFVYTNDEELRVPIEVYYAGRSQLNDVPVSYTLSTNGEEKINTTLGQQTVPVGKCTSVGEVVYPLQDIQVPAKFTLTVRVGNNSNHWDFWVYLPPKLGGDRGLNKHSEKKGIDACSDPQPPNLGGLYIADSLSSEALQVLAKGGTVLLTAAGRVTLGSDVKQNYLPVFWNTSWFKMRPPHTTGAYIDTKHPLFKYDFPTDDWANLNWWELLNKAQVMNLMELPKNYQSPIQPIDTWHVSRKLGMLIEAHVGKGRLLMTTMDISNNLEHRPVARQMRQSILRYMQSPDFQPAITLSVEQIQHFFTKQAPPVNMFTNDSPDELKPKIK